MTLGPLCYMMSDKENVTEKVPAGLKMRAMVWVGWGGSLCSKELWEAPQLRADTSQQQTVKGSLSPTAAPRWFCNDHVEFRQRTVILQGLDKNTDSFPQVPTLHCVRPCLETPTELGLCGCPQTEITNRWFYYFSFLNTPVTVHCRLLRSQKSMTQKIDFDPSWVFWLCTFVAPRFFSLVLNKLTCTKSVLSSQERHSGMALLELPTVSPWNNCDLQR